MAENTKIEWAHHTFNPWTGCTKVSPGCDRCFAEAWSKRAGDRVGKWGPGALRVRTTPANWRQPIKWNAEAERLGVRYRVFCASLADVFDNAVPQEWRDDLFTLIEQTPHLDWLLLTKRIGNVGNMLPVPFDFDRLYPNVWLGATICNQDEADRDIPKLLAVPAAKRFLSIEPLLGPVRLDLLITPNDRVVVNALTGQSGTGFETHLPVGQRGLDWVIVGGESGPGARPMHPDWVRSLRDQCQAAGVDFMFKQWGEWSPGNVMAAIYAKTSVRVDKQGSVTPWTTAFRTGSGDWCMHKVGKKAAGRLLDGREWNEVPA